MHPFSPRLARANLYVNRLIMPASMAFGVGIASGEPIDIEHHLDGYPP